MIKKTLIITVLSLTLLGCGSNLTEEERYEKLKSSYAYKGYKLASSKGMAPVLLELNKQAKSDLVKKAAHTEINYQLKPTDGHLALGLLWAISMKPTFAIAESNIAMESKHNQNAEYHALTVLALAMYQKGWPTLARQTSEQAKVLLGNQKMAEKMEYEQMGAYVAFGLLALQEGDKKGIHASFQGMSDITKQPWLTDLGDSFAMIRTGNISGGVAKINQLSEDNQVSPKVRASLKKFITQIEAEFGKADSDFLYVKVLGKGLLETVLEVDDSKFQEMIAQLESFQAKLQ